MIDERADGEMIASYASPNLRDQFLAALDADDRALFTRLAASLTGCSNPLPGMTCQQMGLPIGSTYGSAASHVLSHDATATVMPPGDPSKPEHES